MCGFSVIFRIGRYQSFQIYFGCNIVGHGIVLYCITNHNQCHELATLKFGCLSTRQSGNLACWFDRVRMIMTIPCDKHKILICKINNIGCNVFSSSRFDSWSERIFLTNSFQDLLGFIPSCLPSLLFQDYMILDV